jgi:CRP-like cAMP-binding protein
MESTELQKIHFFKDFHLEDLETLMKYIEIEKFSDEQSIIEQGSMNLSIYFLISGQVNILIDNTIITSFTDVPVTLGEMSFVSNELASATVKAASDVTVISIGINKINQLTQPEHHRLRMYFYRSCAEILAKKLQATNDLAQTYKSLL